jgi:hypothetical protein
MEELFPNGRRLIKPDSACVAHVRAFTQVLKLAMDVNPAEFAKANVTKASGVTQTTAAKHAALILKLRQAIQNCMQITDNMDEQKQTQVSLLRYAVRNFGEFFYRTSSGIGPVVQPILPQGILTANNHMMMKLLTTSTSQRSR